MNDSGPWGARDGRASAPPPPDPAPVEVEAVDKGQHPVWAVGSTLLMGAFLWWITGRWEIAFAVLFGLFVHEYGHVLAMNRVGMGPARIYIIPFLGGLAKGQRAPKSEWHGVLVSLAGPAFGLLAMAPFIALWAVTGAAAWLVGAFFIAMLNLLNLVPAPPLDGSKALGPVLTRVHPRLEHLVLLAVGAAVVWWGMSTGRFILAAFLAIAVLGHLRRGVWRNSWGALSWAEAGRSLGLYLLTAVVCAAAAVGALLPLADGSPQRALQIGFGWLGIGG